MKCRVIIFMALCSGLFSCGSSKKATTEQEMTMKGTAVKEITIDGKENDWKNVILISNPKNTFEYAVVHSDKDVYVLMKVSSPMEQTKLLRGGMEIWIDPLGRKAKETEVIFPVKGELSETSMRPENVSTDQRANMAMMHRKITTELISLNRVGFKPEYSGVQSIFQNTGFKAAINWDEDNDLIYELKIPLDAFKQHLPKDNIEMEFVVNGVDRPKTTNEQGNGNTNFNQGGSGRGMNGGGGGMRGNRGGGGYSNRQGRGQSTNRNSSTNNDWKNLTENESFWIRYSL